MNTFDTRSSAHAVHSEHDRSGAGTPIPLLRLPYAEDALAPVVSGRTVGLHYGRHHKTYVETLNKLIAGTEFADRPLETIVRATAGKADKAAIFDNAAQAWNHAFYWRSLKPAVAGDPTGALRDAIGSAFGSIAEFRKELCAAAVAQFGSGWAWLVIDAGRLKVVTTGNADVPFIRGQVPLLTIDVWEHAYYLDYQNQRVDYVNALVAKLLNWEFGAENFAKA